MLRIRSCIILLLINFILTGCTVNEELVTLRDNNVIVKKWSIESVCKYGKYNLISTVINGKDKQYVFDLQNEKIYPEESSDLINKFKIIDTGEGKLNVVEKLTGKLVFDIDLVKEGYMKSHDKIRDGDVSISNTGKYIFIDLDKNVFFNMKNKTQIKPSIQGRILSMNWSFDDSKAILEVCTDEEKNMHVDYIWDIKSNSLTQIGDIDEQIYWTPDNKYIYYNTYKDNFEGSSEETIIRYGIKSKSWEDIYVAEGFGNINEANIKWISADEVILIEEHRNSSPLLPNSFLVTKVNIKTDEKTIKKIETLDIINYMWSFDNKYVYFCDENYVMYKAKIDFDK